MNGDYFASTDSCLPAGSAASKFPGATLKGKITIPSKDPKSWCSRGHLSPLW